jgi:hypothetical protein
MGADRLGTVDDRSIRMRPTAHLGEDTMHAALVKVTIDPVTADAARSALQEQIIPMIKASPGFIAGYWLEPKDGHSFSIVVFESEDQARAAAPPAGASPTAGVTVDDVEFRSVVGHG